MADRVLLAHRLVEAMKFGFAKCSYLGDEDFVNVTKVSIAVVCYAVKCPVILRDVVFHCVLLYYMVVSIIVLFYIVRRLYILWYLVLIAILLYIILYHFAMFVLTALTNLGSSL